MNLVELVEANSRGRSAREMQKDSNGLIIDPKFFTARSINRMGGFPQVRKIQGIAEVLEVSPMAVVLAVAEQLGFGQTELGSPDDTALRSAQARADRLQVELDKEREQTRRLDKRLTVLESRQESMRSRVTPVDDDSESEYWREHALHYRARLARYEGLHPLSPRHIEQTLQNLANIIK